MASEGREYTVTAHYISFAQIGILLDISPLALYRANQGRAQFEYPPPRESLVLMTPLVIGSVILIPEQVKRAGATVHSE